MFFIILTTALTLNKAGVTKIETSKQAAEALQPLAGHFAAVLFAIGVVGTGLLAIPTLAGSAAYAFAETFGCASRVASSTTDSGARLQNIRKTKPLAGRSAKTLSSLPIAISAGGCTHTTPTIPNLAARDSSLVKNGSYGLHLRPDPSELATIRSRKLPLVFGHRLIFDCRGSLVRKCAPGQHGWIGSPLTRNRLESRFLLAFNPKDTGSWIE
jgi:hypothetical protein